jgi:CubicO group peptidase (beta-lactamase class C family)
MGVRRLVVLTIVAGLTVNGQSPAQPTARSTDEIVGLWKAKRSFGPNARGPLVLLKTASGWKADFMGALHAVTVEGAEMSFQLPNNEGSFSGKLEAGRVRGHWISGHSSAASWAPASPVVLTSAGPDRMRGAVIPPENELTFFLLIQKEADGTFSAIMRNPERDLGSQRGVNRITLDANGVTVFGKRGNQPESIVWTGSYDAESRILSVLIPQRGGHFDFTRDSDEGEFYPRGKRPGQYSYAPPPELNDGWPAATVSDVDIDRKGIEALVQSLLDVPMEVPATPKIHALLIARHGKLVVEEYFHGQDRYTLHDLRSATKSITATVVGAAMHAGAPLKLSTPVYELMKAYAPTADADPRKRVMTLEHLLTMSSGFYCDDSDENAPGKEDRMQHYSEEPDFIRYTMGVPMASAPGEKAVYCSANPHLALGMVAEATKESPLRTFDRLVATPLGITHYAWYLEPVGRPYGAGSLSLTARDFLKFGQVMLNDGMWRGHRILGHDFAAAASSARYHLWGYYYGYLWWLVDFPYKNRTVRAFYAGGAGGQAVIVVPELDIVIGTFGGNYYSPGTYFMQMNVTPRLLLPAVREKGDSLTAPIVPRVDFAPKLNPKDDAGPVIRKPAGKPR